MKKSAQPFNAIDLLRQAWRTLLRSPGVLFGATALYLAFELRFPSLNFGYVQYSPSVVALIGMGVSAIVTAILSVLLLAGLIKVFLMAHDDHKPNLGELFRHRRLFWKFLFTEVMVALIVMIGLIFLIIPGVILALRLYFAGFISVDKELGPTDAIKESWRITSGRTWLVFKMVIVLIAVNIVASFANAGGLLLSLSLSLIVGVSAYRLLETHRHSLAESETA